MPDSRSASRVSSRVRRKRARAREEIVESATGLLRAGGVEAVTLESVAGALGMTKQALYHYFPSKEALMRVLVTSLLEEEIEYLLKAVETADSPASVAESLIRAFCEHYRDNLGAFRAVYCQSQLYSAATMGMDPETLRTEINPRTHRLFDVLEARLATTSADRRQREHARRFAFVAWTSALGLLTMLSVAKAVGDPLIHGERDLTDLLADIFRRSVPA